jgi:transcription initiation factor TFIID subunit 5
VNWHPNSAYVVTGSSDKTCRLYDIQRGSAVRLYTGHNGPISCVEISPDGKLLATAAEDSAINVYDINSAKVIKSFRAAHTLGSSIYSLAFSKDSAVLLSGGSDCSVRVWDVKRNNTTTNAMVPGAQNPDLLATYHTKQTPVYKLAFTGANVACAAGAFTPLDA